MEYNGLADLMHSTHRESFNIFTTHPANDLQLYVNSAFQANLKVRSPFEYGTSSQS